MQCSAAMDVLFLLDGSYSVGKGSFERSKHYAIKLCQALDIGPDKVRILLSISLFSFSCVSVIIDATPPFDQVRVGLIQFGSTPRLEFGLDSHTTKQELKKHMKKVSYRCVSPQMNNVWGSKILLLLLSAVYYQKNPLHRCFRGALQEQIHWDISCDLLTGIRRNLVQHPRNVHIDVYVNTLYRKKKVIISGA